MVGGELRLRAAGLEQAGDVPVQRAATRPAGVAVDRLTDQVVPKGDHAVLDLLAEKPSLEHLVEPGVAPEFGEERGVDLGTDRGGGLECCASVVGEDLDSNANCVAERLGHRDRQAVVELEAAASAPEPAPVLSAAASSSTKNGTPCVRS